MGTTCWSDQKTWNTLFPSRSEGLACWKGTADLWSPLLTIIAGLTFLPQSVSSWKAKASPFSLLRLWRGWNADGILPTLAWLTGLAGVGGDAMLLLPHAADEKGLDPMHVALVWAQRRRTQKSYASGVSASVVSVAPEATSTSKLSGYPKALTNADPTANTDFIYLFDEVSTVCQALLLQSWKPSWVVKVPQWACEDLMHMRLCVS